MPFEVAVVLALTVLPFLIFAAALAYGEYRANHRIKNGQPK
jgi:hypothetical protein